MRKKKGKERIAIVFDGKKWFVRHIRVIVHDLERDEKVYKCDKPIGPVFKTLGSAVAWLEGEEMVEL